MYSWKLWVDSLILLDGWNLGRGHVPILGNRRRNVDALVFRFVRFLLDLHALWIPRYLTKKRIHCGECSTESVDLPARFPDPADESVETWNNRSASSTSVSLAKGASRILAKLSEMRTMASNCLVEKRCLMFIRSSCWSLPNGDGNGGFLANFAFVDARSIAHHHVLIAQFFRGTLRETRSTFTTDWQKQNECSPPASHPSLIAYLRQ